jgi:hypothetical protein
MHFRWRPKWKTFGLEGVPALFFKFQILFIFQKHVNTSHLCWSNLILHNIKAPGTAEFGLPLHYLTPHCGSITLVVHISKYVVTSRFSCLGWLAAVGAGAGSMCFAVCHQLPRSTRKQEMAVTMTSRLVSVTRILSTTTVNCRTPLEPVWMQAVSTISI